MKQQLEIINEQEVLGKDFKIYGTFENPLFLALVGGDRETKTQSTNSNVL